MTTSQTRILSNHGSVAALCKKTGPGLPKYEVDNLRLIENHGVEGDYHAGEFVRHRYLAKKDPTKPNLAQVLLVDTSTLDEIARQDIQLNPGMLGENIVVDGINMMSLAIGTRIQICDSLLELTEVRSPCYQLNEIHPLLLKAVARKIDGQVQINAGMMARVLKGGRVRVGDPVTALKE